MAMQVTFGSFIPDKRDGWLRPVYFPELARMDEETPDGRLLESDGGGARTLPRSIMGQFITEVGHFMAEVAGPLQEVTLHEDGNISGKGWLLDDDNGRRMNLYLETDALRHNSVDLADVVAVIEWKSDDPSSPDFWEYTIIFKKWNIATTTFVNVPAFPEARGELTASYSADDVLEVRFESTIITFDEDAADNELTAGLYDDTVPWEDFHIPEARVPTKIVVDENGRVYGHLAQWGKCHDGVKGRCVFAPKPATYATFCAPGVLTDRGMVETGPIFALGGHPRKPIGNGDPWAAYGGIENAWADVRVTNGQIGPWISGRVRPGVDADMLYAVRASKISGHWFADRNLAAIVSVNVPGFRMPGSELAADVDGGRYEDGELVELVASLHAAPVEVAEDFDPVAFRAEMETRLNAELAKMTTASMTMQPRPALVMPPNGNHFSAWQPNSTSTAVAEEVTVTLSDEVTVEVEIELSDDDGADPPVHIDGDDGDDEVETEAAALELELELAANLPLKT